MLEGENSQQPIFNYLTYQLTYFADPSIEPGTVHTVLYLTHHQQQPVACSLLGQIG